MVEAIVGIISIIVGTVLGFLLSEQGTKKREEREEKKQAKSSGAIVCLEIDINLGLLEEFHRQVNQGIETTDSPDIRKRKLAHRFIEVPLTEFKRAAFESQLYLLGLSMPEQELTRVFLFYDCLSKIEALRNTSTIAYQEQQESWNLASQGKGFVSAGVMGLSRKFDANAPKHWEECESLITRLINEGNPLKKKSVRCQEYEALDLPIQENKMTNNSNLTSHEDKRSKCMDNKGIWGGIYGMAFIGGVVYYIQHATSFWAAVLGIFKALFWPAVLMYKLLELLKM